MNKENRPAYLIGIGLVLFVVHNPYQPLLNYAFIPWVGTALIIIGVMLVINKTKDWRSLPGDKQVWIPLVVIATSIIISSIWAEVEGRGEEGTLMGSSSLALMLFGVYVATRQIDREKLFKPFIWAVVIESVSIVVWAATHGWKYNGGLVSPTNYDMATGLVVFGVLVSPSRHQWWLATVGAVGLMFSGSGEAIFIGVVMFVVVGVKKMLATDNWKVAVPMTAVALSLILMTLTNVIWKAQEPNLVRFTLLMDTVNGETTTARTNGFDYPTIDKLIGYRLTHWQLSPIKPFGYGMNVVHFYPGIPHNIALIIIEQVGILALLAWLWIAWLGVKRKETRYLWIGFLALGVFDHFIWTMACPWFWAIASGIKVKEGQNAL